MTCSCYTNDLLSSILFFIFEKQKIKEQEKKTKKKKKEKEKEKPHGVSPQKNKNKMERNLIFSFLFYLPLPSFAPSIIPGRSSSWIFAPLYLIVPGTQVNVVNSYDATSECVPVSFDMSVDFPTEGKPIRPTLAEIWKCQRSECSKNKRRIQFISLYWKNKIKMCTTTPGTHHFNLLERQSLHHHHHHCLWHLQSSPASAWQPLLWANQDVNSLLFVFCLLCCEEKGRKKKKKIRFSSRNSRPGGENWKTREKKMRITKRRRRRRKEKEREAHPCSFASEPSRPQCLESFAMLSSFVSLVGEIWERFLRCGYCFGPVEGESQRSWDEEIPDIPWYTLGPGGTP